MCERYVTGVNHAKDDLARITYHFDALPDYSNRKIKKSNENINHMVQNVMFFSHCRWKWIVVSVPKNGVESHTLFLSVIAKQTVDSGRERGRAKAAELYTDHFQEFFWRASTLLISKAQLL